MFKVPDWGDDVPKNNIDLKKLFPKGKNKSKAKHSKIQANGVLKNNFKAKDRLKSVADGKITQSKLKHGINNNSNNKKLNGKATPIINNVPEKNKHNINKKLLGKVIPKIKNVQEKNKHNKNKKPVGKVTPKVNNVQKKTETKPSPNHIDIKNYDTDKLDEVLLDAKKKNLTNLYKMEDNEETLFTENRQTSVETSKTSHNVNKVNSNIKPSPEKYLKNDISNRIKGKKQLMQANINSSKRLEKINKKNNEKTIKTETKKLKNKEKKSISSPIETNTNEKCNRNSKNIEFNVKNEKLIVKDSNSEMMGTKLNNSNNVKNIGDCRKKKILKDMLQIHRSQISTVNRGVKLRERMLEKLNAAKFRFLNEKLYTSSGSEAQKLFQEDPAAFQTYHQGYQQQVKKWPVNPLDVVVRRIQNMPKTHLVADMGCGEAALSKRVSQNVRSFDLVATAPGVEVCDMAHTPLLSDSVHVAVYCLALMGTDLTQYLVEANRILKMGGHLLIAEVESRFEDVDTFCKEVQKFGFTLRKLDKSHEVFYFMEFTKANEVPSKKSKLPKLYLKPCIYKRR